MDDYNRNATITLRGVVEDDDGNALPASSLVSLTCTLYDGASKNILNSRDAQNIKNLNGGAVDARGNFTLQLTAADMVIVDARKPELSEIHVLQIAWTWLSLAGATLTGRQEFQFGVRRLARLA